MKHYHYLGIILAAGVIGGAVVWSSAQEAPAEPQPAQSQGERPEAAAARERFEQELGAPFESFGAPPVERPEIPRPEAIPDAVKKLVPESDLLQLYCATAKWKTGTFFAAMDALKAHLIPAIQQARLLGVDMSAPDVDGMKAEGTKRLQAICAAKTLADAESAASDFARWGADVADSGMMAQRADMDAKMRAAGDDIRVRVKEALDPVIKEESAKMEADINAEAESAAKDIVAGLLASNPKSPPDTSAVTAAVTARIQPTIDRKTAELQAKISEKARTVAGPLQAKLEAIGKLFEGLDAKIAASTASGERRYAAEKKKALSLRVKFIMAAIGKNMDEAAAKLDGIAPQLDEARKTDPSVKTVAALKADMAASRDDLRKRLEAAVAADDEAAIDDAIAAFADMWERVSADAERAAAEPAAAICAQAKAQIAEAKKQMDPAKAQIDALVAKCASDASEACLAVNELAGRLDGLSGKIADMDREMALVDEACAASPVDTARLAAILEKLRNDGTETGMFADALRSEKAKRVADSAKQVCADAGPTLDAARAALANDDLVALKKTIDGCRGVASVRCDQVASVSARYDAFVKKAAAFMAEAEKVSAACNGVIKDDDAERIMTSLSALGEQGTSLEADAAALRADMEEKGGARAFCRALGEKLAFAKQDVADGLRQAADAMAPCAASVDAKCAKVKALAPDLGTLRATAASLLKRIAAAETGCAAPAEGLPPQSRIDEADAIAAAGAALKADVAAFKAKVDAAVAAAPTGLWIEAESEARTSLLPKTESWHSHKWTAAAPWRPPLFGAGYWYLSRGGEWLEYDLTVPAAGTYQVWVRDYVDKFQPRGVRRITLTFDGKTYGTFPETTVAAPGDKGAFGWHKVGGGVTVAAGKHVMRVAKESTTSGAAILDAFYLTNGADAPPEK